VTDLTPKQFDALKAMLEYREKHGFWPSLRELAEYRGCSIGTIQGHLFRLKQKKYITWKKGTPRAFTILKKP